MDPTAPQNNNQQNPNNNNPQGPSAPSSSHPQQASPWSVTPNPPVVSPEASQETSNQNNPILPGQFVVSQEYTPPQNNPPPQSSLTQNIPQVLPQTQVSDLPPSDLSNYNQPIDHQITTPQSPVITSQPNPQNNPPIQSPITSGSQPDPTPFVPPNPQSAPQGFSKPPGGIKNLRVVIIVVGVFILVLIIGAIAWFLLSGNKLNQAAKTQSQLSPEPSISQPPIPVRTKGGFSELYSIFSSGIQPQESTPAASGSTKP